MAISQVSKFDDLLTLILRVQSLIDAVNALTIRLPNPHHATHELGGSDAIQLDNLSTPDDNTDLNATTSAHGLLRKLSGNATDYLTGAGNWATLAIPNPIVQDLLFTDATYDIGKTGATRPRDQFLSRNLVVGGNTSITGNLTITGLTTHTGNTSVQGKLTANGITATLAVVEAVVTLTDGATPALDASLGNVFRLVAAGDRTIAVPTNATTGQKIIIQHLASGGARTLALNAGAGGFRFGSDITALTQTVSGKTDYIGCIYSGADSKWDVVAYVKGY